MKTTKKSKAIHYVDNVKLAEELMKYKATGEISEELGCMFELIAKNMGNKKNFINYTYKDDMIGKGLYFLCKYSRSFDPNNAKSNAFAYCSQICFNGFVHCLKEEAKHSDIKDKIIKEAMDSSEVQKFLDSENDD